MKKRVIELIRVSTEAQAAEDRAGIPAQRSANQRTAAQYGLDVVRTIQLSDVSGAAVLRTPKCRNFSNSWSPRRSTGSSRRSLAD